MSHSMPTNVPLVPGIDNVPRTPRTPRGTLLDRQDPRFYPVVKDGTKPDPQVSIMPILITVYLQFTVTGVTVVLNSVDQSLKTKTRFFETKTIELETKTRLFETEMDSVSH